MKNIAIVALSALLIIPLAGCLGAEETDPEGTDAAPADSASPTSDSAAAGAEPNVTAAQAVIIVSVGGNVSVADNGSYAVPVGVNVTFDGSSSVGEDLAFAWDFGEGNTSDEAVATFAFPAGAFNVTLRVTGAANETDAETVAVVASLDGPVVLRSDKKTFTGEFVVGYQVATACTAAEVEDVDFATFTWTLVDKEADGTLSVANHTTLKLTATATDGGQNGLDLDLFFLDSAGKTVAKSDGATATETIDLNRDLPAGTYTVRIEVCSGVDVSFTVVAEAIYVSRSE